LREGPTLRGEQDNGCVRLPFYGLHGFKDGFGLEHHAGATAIGIVIHGAVFTMGMVPNIVEVDADQLLVHRPFEDARVKHALEHLGKQGQNVDLQLV
jgi:hypothetical protein